MDGKAALKLIALLALALVVIVGVAGYGRQMQEDLAHHRMMEAPEDRRALTEVLQMDEIRQRLLAEEESAPAPAPGSDSAQAPTSASYGSSAPSSTSSSSGSSSSSSSGSGSSGNSALGGIASGRRMLQ